MLVGSDMKVVVMVREKMCSLQEALQYSYYIYIPKR